MMFVLDLFIVPGYFVKPTVVNKLLLRSSCWCEASLSLLEDYGQLLLATVSLCGPNQ